MPIGRSLLLAAAQNDTLNRFALKSPIVKRATKAFMPGERPEDALDAGARLTSDGRSLIYTKLGEALTALSDADAVRDHYLWFFDQVAARRLPAQVSIKPTQLGIDQSETACRDHCLALAAKAQATGSVLWLDMEDTAYVDRTLSLYEAVKAAYPDTGLALQAYLYRTPKDVERLRPLAPVIRLVKGCPARIPANIRMVDPELPASSIDSASRSPSSPTPSTVTSDADRPILTPSPARQSRVLWQSRAVE